MRNRLSSPSPTILLRISSGRAYMHRAFKNYDQAARSGEAFAEAGFSVAMHSATGQFLQGFVPRPTPPAPPTDATSGQAVGLSAQ